jgi:copper resistance protein B
MPEHRFTHIMLDQFEGRTSGDSSELRWDGEAWHGGDTHRLWLKSEAFVNGATVSDGDHELLYDRPLPRLRYFDAQAGLRMDIDSDPTRAWFALGVEGLAPYHFELAPTLYLRNGGRVAGRIVAMEDLLLTQRWIAQPEAELNFYSQDDAPRDVGSGLSDLDTGIRLRYEITRKFAPYVGFAWNGRFADAANFARQSGQPDHQPRFVFGLFVWR